MFPADVKSTSKLFSSAISSCPIGVLMMRSRLLLSCAGVRLSSMASGGRLRRRLVDSPLAAARIEQIPRIGYTEALVARPGAGPS
jgi:hypothetical protein